MEVNMEENTFIGMGHNPEPGALDIPEGFGSRLSQDSQALHHFSQLNVNQKNDLIRYMQQAKTGEDSEFRVMNAVEMLRNNQADKIISVDKRDYI